MLALCRCRLVFLLKTVTPGGLLPQGKPYPAASSEEHFHMIGNGGLGVPWRECDKVEIIERV